MTLVGSVQSMIVLIIDDMIDTCGTIVMAAQTCMDNGAVEVWAIATHGVLSDPAIERIQACNSLKVARNVLVSSSFGSNTASNRA